MVRLLYKYTDRYDTGIQGSEVVHFDICVDRIFKVHCLKYSLNFQGESNKILFFILSKHMEFYPPLFPVPVGISCPLSMHTCLTIVKYFAPKKTNMGTGTGTKSGAPASRLKRFLVLMCFPKATVARAERFQ